ncbi:hypothetical protein SAMN05444392_102415 [Seinonella peptonophila]|uniref:Uncharacterized protein n=1 Tax=Seinonella peptonophila TaxID=112248 RepID=A0A1M4VLI6_9BACL|nr:hypothetical protein [Seinonella peptonophila]SHE69690.1 hypothetical protein SAMN05444392_102415 [Seinonella peptonophila]
MHHDTKKGKYTSEENEQIISTINQGIAEGRNEREILKELATQLNRGYAGIMSHVRKLRSEFPDRFNSSDDSEEKGPRLNSWEESEEDLVIQTVNEFLSQKKSLSAAIAELEKKLSRTQGAIYQRIYTLRRKYPEKFDHLPAQRPRRRRKFQDWHMSRPPIQELDEFTFNGQQPQASLSSETERQFANASDHLLKLNQDIYSNQQTWVQEQPQVTSTTTEEEMLVKAFEDRYGRLIPDMKRKLIQLMRTYGCTRVSIAIFTLNEDKGFPATVVEFLEQRLQTHKFL